MNPDENGFLYPEFDVSKCIGCSKCDHLCAFNNLKDARISSNTFVARHKSDSVCKGSTSGGMFTAISDVFLESGSVIYSPMFDSEMYLRHQRITNSKDRDDARGSKYIQSDLSCSFAQLIHDLKESRNVAFFGTPCQVAGIKSLVPLSLQENLFTIDVVCNGVGSPFFWKQHKEKMESKYHDKMINYVFRPKKYGYLTLTELAVFKNKGEMEIISDIDRYNIIYYSRLVMRPCCSNCKYCSSQRVSDITISDFSKAERQNIPFDTENGVSSLLINSEKGKQLFYKFKKDILYKEVTRNTIQQVRLTQCESINPEANDFMKNCRKYGIEVALNKHFGFAKRVKIKIKEIYRRIVL